MPDDAMTQWQRELKGAQAAPPSRPRPELSARLAVPVTLGILTACVVLFAHGWPPELELLPYLAAPTLALAAGLATRRGTGETLLWMLAAASACAVTVLVIVPAWGALELFECWMSWLSDC